MIGRSNAGMGGGGLRVIAVTDEANLPAVCADNTIAVMTQEPIGEITLDTLQPLAPASGDIWIRLSVGGTVGLQIGARPGMVVRPTAVMQYLNAAWTHKDCRVRASGEWAMAGLYLYRAGNGFPSLTGGWGATTEVNATGSWTKTKLSIGDSSLNGTITGAATVKMQYACTETAVNLAGYTGLRSVYDLTCLAGTEYYQVFFLRDKVGAAASTVSSAYKQYGGTVNVQDEVFVASLPSIETPVFICVAHMYATSGTSTIAIKEIALI